MATEVPKLPEKPNLLTAEKKEEQLATLENSIRDLKTKRDAL